MTLRDLEEVIASLEYLLNLDQVDAMQKNAYAQQLQAFQVLLQAANEPDWSTPAARGSLDYDTNVALLYAEEELFLAAQALKAGGRVSIAHRHLCRLLEHEQFLPPEIARCLRSLDAIYSRTENSGATQDACAEALTPATMALLNAVRSVSRSAVSLASRDVPPLISLKRKRTG